MGRVKAIGFILIFFLGSNLNLLRGGVDRVHLIVALVPEKKCVEVSPAQCQEQVLLLIN